MPREQQKQATARLSSLRVGGFVCAGAACKADQPATNRPTNLHTCNRPANQTVKFKLNGVLRHQRRRRDGKATGDVNDINGKACGPGDADDDDNNDGDVGDDDDDDNVGDDGRQWTM